MVIKNPKLGGSYRAFGSEGKSQDENDTDDAIIDLAAAGVTQNAYQTLKHSGTFDNKDNLGADRFTDENGINNTVNTGSSSAVYDGANDKYINEIYDDLSGFTTLDPDSVTNSQNAFDGNSSTFAEKTITTNSIHEFILGKTFNSTFFDTLRVKASSTKTSGSVFSFDGYLYVETFDGTNWDIIETVYEGTNKPNYSIDTILTINDNIQGIRVRFNVDSGVDTYTISYKWNMINLSSGYNSISKVISNSNIKTLTGDESGICVYADKINTANTNITYNVSDGTTTISDLEFNTFNGIASLGSGQLAITFNLSTTNTSETPELYGYSYYIN